MDLPLSLREFIIAVSIFGGGVALALLVHFLLKRVVPRLTARTKTTLDDRIVKAVSRPVFLGILAIGTFAALNAISWVDDNAGGAVDKLFTVIGLLIGMWMVLGLATAFIAWYADEIAARTQSAVDDRLVPVVRRVLGVTIFGIGLVLILSELGINISPLVAALGISGIAVAFAVQPTLGNFVAGTYIIPDARIRVGDFIEVDEKTRGFVEEVGWRSAKLRTPLGNLLVIPNTKLADSTLTNYSHPTPEVILLVSCGVSYASDLQRVESIALEVASEVIRACPGAVAGFQPVVRFNEFGDSNININVVVKAVDWASQYVVRHELVKALHARFSKEGIEISYPVRKIVMDKPSDGARLPVAGSGKELPPKAL